MREYIKENSKKKLREYYLFKSIPVFVKDQVNENISVQNVLKAIEQRIPKKLFNNLDVIYVGQFEDLVEREVSAAYLNGAIYLDHNISSEEDFVENITHELAHCVEVTRSRQLYADGILEREFIEKRKKLLSILLQQGYKLKDKAVFFDAEYNEDFDELLYQEIGYLALTGLSSSLFFSPYGITSLREYYANGFEAYFSGKARELKRVSPVLFKKISEELID